MKRVAREFDRFAQGYCQSNTIQQNVAAHLVSKLPICPTSCLDLGAGHGEIYHRIGDGIEQFIAVDIAPALCEKHPIGQGINVLIGDFDESRFWDEISPYLPCELILSSSALQWSSCLPLLLDRIASHSSYFACAIFTSATFANVYKQASLQTFLPNKDDVMKWLFDRFDGEIEYKTWTQSFPDALALFRYIKRSGLNGKGGLLTYRTMKELIASFPDRHLEFEVTFFWGKSKKSSFSKL